MPTPFFPLSYYTIHCKVEKAQIAKTHNAFYLVDAAQTAGIFPIDIGRMHIDLLAFPGHKGLLGPHGTGGLIIGPNVSLRPLIYGGTGSLSESDRQPDFLPDALESGTLNLVGIAGLGAGISYIKKIGIEQLRRREQLLCQRLIDGLQKIPEIRLYGGIQVEHKAPIIAFNIGCEDSMTVSHLLDKERQVISRGGLHCAPRAHETMGTLHQGVVRFSPSHFTTEEEIDLALNAVRYTTYRLLGN